MGMSASQARYLQLTARKSNLEFEAQQICHKRLRLAERSERIATAYTEGINDRHLYFNAPYTVNNAINEETDEAKNLVEFREKSPTAKRLDYYDITNPLMDEIQPGLGMRIVNKDGKIVAPSIPAGAEPEDYEVEPALASSQYGSQEAWENACNMLEDKLRTAEWFLQQKVVSGDDASAPEWVDANTYTIPYIEDLLYEENDSAVVAQYTRDIETVQHQDKMLEMRLQQVTTEQKAIETEIDAVKKVIEKNVESSFKTFG